jgi:hypothetical protein
MNVKSKFDTQDEGSDRTNQYMRGGCGSPFSMISGPTRMDVSNLRPPGFTRRIFRAMGWKTDSEKKTDSK